MVELRDASIFLFDVRCRTTEAILSAGLGQSLFAIITRREPTTIVSDFGCQRRYPRKTVEA